LTDGLTFGGNDARPSVSWDRRF